MTTELKEVFSTTYEQNLWNSLESRSGTGSELKNTKTIRSELPELFKKFNIQSILDIPCGDFNWMKEINLSNITYTGADIVENLIQKNKQLYPNTDFRLLDITTSELPTVDLILARDVLVHFGIETIHKAIENFKKSKSKYLLATSFMNRANNADINNGQWRPLNLCISPFNFNPIYLINENCEEGNFQYNDKCLVLFEISKMT